MENHPISKLEFTQAKALSEATAIFQDLGFVVQATKKLSALLKAGEPDQVIARSLFTAALVSYVRCFSSGKRSVLTPKFMRHFRASRLRATTCTRTRATSTSPIP